MGGIKPQRRFKSKNLPLSLFQSKCQDGSAPAASHLGLGVRGKWGLKGNMFFLSFSLSLIYTHIHSHTHTPQAHPVSLPGHPSWPGTCHVSFPSPRISDGSSGRGGGSLAELTFSPSISLPSASAISHGYTDPHLPRPANTRSRHHPSGAIPGLLSYVGFSTPKLPEMGSRGPTPSLSP